MTYFPFTGNAVDAISGATATNSGATGIDDRFQQLDRAYYFDGTDWMSADLADLPLDNAPRALSLWVRSADGQQDGNAEHIANWGAANTNEAFGLMDIWGGQWCGYMHNADIGTNTYIDTAWHHLVINYDGTTARVYVDGQLKGSASRNLITAAGPLLIGIRPDLALANTFDGDIDDIRIYNRALAAGEIASLYTWENTRAVVDDAAYIVRLDYGDQVNDLDFGDREITPPTVTGVLVGGSTWSAGFLGALGALDPANVNGHSIPVGTGAQLLSLPWASLNRIRVRFSEDVVIDKEHLRLVGVLGPDGVPDANATYGVASSSFTYDSATFTATWTLPAAMAVDRLLLLLNADGASPIRDAAGNRLDGEWANPLTTADAGSDTFPSGDGAPGGDFAFRFNVLPADLDQDGVVSIRDTALMRPALGSSTSGSSYCILADLNGDARIDGADIAPLRSQQGKKVPEGKPAAASGRADGLVGELSVLAVERARSAGVGPVPSRRRELALARLGATVRPRGASKSVALTGMAGRAGKAAELGALARAGRIEGWLARTGLHDRRSGALDLLATQAP